MLLPRIDARFKLLSVFLICALLVGVQVISSFTPRAVRAAQVTLGTQWADAFVNNNNYYVMNNVWGAATAQTLTIPDNATTGWNVTSSHQQALAGPPASYPAIVKGCHSRDLNPNNGTQKCTAGWMYYQASSISTANVTWNLAVPTSGSWNAALDVWYGTSPGAYNDLEIMLWANNSGYRSTIQPIGSLVETKTIDGVPYEIWVGTTSGGNPSITWDVVSYVRASNYKTTALTVNLLPLQQDAIARGKLASSSYLTGIDAGFEIWTGTNLQTTSFSASVSGSGGVSANNSAPTATRTSTTASTGATVTRTRTPTVSSSGTTYYRLTARHSGKVADVASNSTADGGNVHQWTWGGGNNQQWQFQATDSGYYKIISRSSGKCLEVAGWSTADGGNVQQWACGSGNNQQWIMQTTDNGYFKLVNRHSGKCMDVAGGPGATGDSANIHQWSCGSGYNQQWIRQ